MQKHKAKAIMMFVIAGVLIALGTIILPEVTNIGKTILHIIIGSILLIYVFVYLFRKIVLKSKGHTLILSLVEMIVLLFVAVTCILQEWINISIVSEGCKIIGLCFWIRGVVEILRLHLNGTGKYGFYKTIFNVILITAGTWFFVAPLFSNFELIYVFSILFFVIAIILITTGIMIITRGPKKAN